MTNQPTDATRFKAALYAQCPEPVADDIWQRFESLTAQLAATQAQAKALESWGERMAYELKWLTRSTHTRTCQSLSFNTPCTCLIRTKADVALEVPKPQPVDASSLARIARCAQFPDALFYQNLNNPQAARRLVNHWLDNYNALTPNDIALAQALVGGA